MQKVEITVDPDGAVHFEGYEFTGAECEKFIKKLTDGLTITSISKKPEYFRAKTTVGSQVKS